jgi:hypothetical protein
MLGFPKKIGDFFCFFSDPILLALNHAVGILDLRQPSRLRSPDSELY